MLRILMTVNAMWNLAHFRGGLINALVGEGHDVVALAPFDGHEARVRGLGCQTIDLKMDRKGLSPARDAALIARFARHLRQIRPDIVLSYTIKNNIYCGLAARGFGVPFAPNVTGLGTAFLSGGALQKVAETLYRSSFSKAQMVFFQNGDDADLFVTKGLVRQSQVRCLPGSGIDIDRFEPQPMPEEHDGLRFLMISRPLRDKGIREYAAAARLVRQKFPETRFQFLGPLNYQNRSAIPADMLRTWFDDGTLEHLSETGDVRPLVAAAHCIILPSYREGLPRTLLEGAAMGRPLIATDVTGCRDVVDDGTTGLLCRAKDANALADAMERLIMMTPGQRVKMGTAGRRKVEARFGESVIIDAYRDLIATLSAAATSGNIP